MKKMEKGSSLDQSSLVPNAAEKSSWMTTENSIVDIPQRSFVTLTHTLFWNRNGIKQNCNGFKRQCCGGVKDVGLGEKYK